MDWRGWWDDAKDVLFDLALVLCGLIALIVCSVMRVFGWRPK